MTQSFEHAPRKSCFQPRFLLSSGSAVHLQPDPPPASAWQVGQRVLYHSGADLFQVERVMGGSMGPLYLVTDVAREEPFAVKSDPSPAGEGSISFAQGADLWLGFGKHPNLVQAIGRDQINGRMVLYLEVVMGGSLRAYLRHGDLPLLRILSLSIAICRGMAWAGQHGLKAHRDLKPDNVLLTLEGVARVTDFGLATRKDAAEMAYGEREAKPEGTREYMPPEQWVQPDVDVRADIYAFGVMLYEMLVGIRPFHGKTEQALYAQHRHHQPARPSTLRLDIPAAIDRLVMTCLEKEPANRYPDFEAVEEALQACIAELGAAAPASPTPFQVEMANWNERAAALFQAGRYIAALKRFEQVLERDPFSRQARLGCAATLGQMGYYDDALSRLDALLDEDPVDPVLLINKGLALQGAGQLDDALDYFAAATKAAHDCAPAWLYRSQVLTTLEWYEPAYYAAHKARRLVPQDARACALEASALLAMGQTHAAAAVIDACAAHAADNPEIIWVRSRLACKQQQWADSLALCLQISPEDAHGAEALQMALQAAAALGLLADVERLRSRMPADRSDSEALHAALAEAAHHSITTQAIASDVPMA